MPAWNLLLTLLPRPLAFSGALAIWLGAFNLASAQAPYDDANTPEGWAWSQIKRGDEADFNQHCLTKPPLDPKNEEDAHWRHDCRKLSSCFLMDLLTRAPRREVVPFAGVRIKGAQITGNVDLENAKLIRPIEIVGSRIEGAIKLSHARTDSLIMLDGSVMKGAFTTDSLHAESDLFLRFGAAFKSDVTLIGAKIDGGVDMTGASFNGTFNASNLQIGGALHGLDLLDASIAGDLELAGPGKPAVWKGNIRKPGALTLRNTHIGNLMDAKDAWPTPGYLHLDGFSFNHLGGYSGDPGTEMRARGMDWWDNWARRDPI